MYFGSKDVFVYRDGALTRLTHNTYDAEDDYTPSSFAPTLSPDGVLGSHTSTAPSRASSSGCARGRTRAPSARGWVRASAGRGR